MVEDDCNFLRAFVSNATVSLNVKTISPFHAGADAVKLLQYELGGPCVCVQIAYEVIDIKGFFGETNSGDRSGVPKNFEELQKERHDIKSYGKGRRSAFLKDVYASSTVKFEVEIQPQNPINLARVRPQM
ncbi:hypothetical protein L2E82_31950 [Cichorium intybus]|uniref:Uncharacterized protein n=1 Tax=Cichorium intybus TaxID=13427 RepID=A0ACB9BFD8_CICIN|nr:hypothetical protein L2E82_31950 [Cichorium intybus]